jgi:hypothetical protein
MEFFLKKMYRSFSRKVFGEKFSKFFWLNFCENNLEIFLEKSFKISKTKKFLLKLVSENFRAKFFREKSSGEKYNFFEIYFKMFLGKISRNLFQKPYKTKSSNFWGTKVMEYFLRKKVVRF